MAFIDNIKKKVTDTTQSAVKATKELAEISRLNSQISDLQRNISNSYLQIGKLYYESHYENAEPPFEEMCSAISEANKQIEKLQLDIQLVKGVKNCANCGNDVPIAADFCGKCGSKVETPVPPTPTSNDEEVCCTNCGASLEDGALFCGSCGQKQEPKAEPAIEPDNPESDSILQ